MTVQCSGPTGRTSTTPMFFNQRRLGDGEGRQQRRDHRGAARGRRLGQRQQDADRLLDRRARRRRDDAEARRSHRPTTSSTPDCDHVADAGPARRQRRGRDRLRVHRRRRLSPARVRRRDEQALRDVAREHRRTHVPGRLPRGVGHARRRTPTRCAAISARAPTPPAFRSRRCCSPPTRSRPATSITRSASSCRTIGSSAATCGRRPTGRTRPAAPAAPSYGVHLRLRADYPVDSLPSEGAKVVARAMQKYGMYHADGGNIALTAQSDRHTTAKWDGLLDPHDLAALQGRRTSRSSTTARMIPLTVRLHA